jgi:hypothetical protein
LKVTITANLYSFIFFTESTDYGTILPIDIGCYQM